MSTKEFSFKIVESKKFQGNDLSYLLGETDGIINVLKSRDKDCDRKMLVPIFRGEPEVYECPLLPSLFRKMANKNKQPCYEKNLVSCFLNQHPQYKYDDVLKSLSIMQHYGFPTRLLDWTSQLEVALYFACIKNPDRDGALYVFVPTLTFQKDGSFAIPIQAFHDSIKYHYFRQVLIPHTEEAHTEFWNELLKRADADETSTIVPWWLVFKPENANEANKREQWQRSIFTFHQGYVNGNVLHAAPAKLIDKFVKQHVAQLIIPAEIKKKILKNLRVKGIYAATLFPEPTYFEEDT